MKLKRILSVILILSIIATSFSSVVQISAQTEEGASNQATQVATLEDGSVQTTARPNEPAYEQIINNYVINNENDFDEFMTTPLLWKNNWKITLACDIDMKGKAFKPIKEFCGVFDGCGHVVSNLKIQDSSVKCINVELALINTLDQFAEIKNVTFDNYTVQGKLGISKSAGLIITNYGLISGIDIINGGINNIDKNGKMTGFVFNNEEDGVIENCSINMSIKNSKIRSGFVGTNYGKIAKCNAILSANGGDVAGGFVSENLGTIEKCSSKGDVDGSKCAGGFCGKNSGEIISCNAEGSVKAKASKVDTISGGFVGENNGIVKKCDFVGNTTGQEYVGGFCGRNKDKGNISSCTSKGDVEAKTQIASIHCGGLAGVNEGIVNDCTFEGKVDTCVDIETLVYSIVGATAAVILATTLIFTLIKKFNAVPKAQTELNAAKEAIDPAKTRLHNAYSALEKDVKKYDLLNIAYEEASKNHNIKEMERIRVKLVHTTSVLSFSTKTYDDALKNYNYVKERYSSAVHNHNMALQGLESWKKSFIISSIVVPILSSFVIGLVLGEAIAYAYVGAFCGYNKGEIIKCNANNSSVEAKTLYNKYNRCGGFVGTNCETGTIKDSGATGKEISNKKYTDGYMGGFVGENIGKIEKSTATVSVNNGEFTGGFCGNNSGEISGSTSEGNATTKAKTIKTKCGGFVGNNNEKGKIDGCTSKGTATGQEYVGGFCGDNTGEIVGSNSEGDATAKTVSNTNRCGGFVGENNGTVKGSTSIGSATGEEYVGGFAGVNKRDIIDCNAHGKATAKTKTHTALAGGFVGENEKGTITDCTSTGGADSRSTSGQAKAGGFVGINKANIIDSKAYTIGKDKDDKDKKIYLSAGIGRSNNGCGGFVGKNDKGGSINGCSAECTVETKKKGVGGGFVGEAKNNSVIKNSKNLSKIKLKNNKLKDAKFYEHKDKKAVIENYYAN